MHGIGNDYIYVNCFKESVPYPEKTAIKVSDRHFGIGSDGLVLIMPSDKADFRMRMFNTDGSEGMMCGNASRCIAKYVYENHLTDKTDITLETKSGIKYLHLNVTDRKVETIDVDMGCPELNPTKIPMKASGDDFIAQPITLCGSVYNVTAVSMGNPHAVIFVPSTDNTDIEKLGRENELSALFPERVNTEFCEILGRNKLKMRVWERGSGETLACGTGACATAVAAVLNGICSRNEKITLCLRGGSLEIVWRNDGHVIMSGPAEFVCTGSIEI